MSGQHPCHHLFRLLLDLPSSRGLTRQFSHFEKFSHKPVVAEFGGRNKKVQKLLKWGELAKHDRVALRGGIAI
jgi:hypothetical protein